MSNEFIFLVLLAYSIAFLHNVHILVFLWCTTEQFNDIKEIVLEQKFAELLTQDFCKSEYRTLCVRNIRHSLEHLEKKSVAICINAYAQEILYICLGSIRVVFYLIFVNIFLRELRAENNLWRKTVGREKGKRIKEDDTMLCRF